MARMYRVVGAVGAITRLFSVAFLLPAVMALIYDEWDSQVLGVPFPSTAAAFVFCAVLVWTLGSVMRAITANRKGSELRDREAYLTVGLGWIWLCLLAMLPFIFTAVLTNPVDAFFEAMSGMTTTGATVIPGHLEDVPPSVHVWRGLLQWIGGMGIVVLSVALIARLTQGGLQMLQAEAPGPSVGRIVPRLASTARILWAVYLSMTLILFGLIFAVLLHHDLGIKQTIFEAFIHAMTTVSTGGFSSHDASIAYFDDWLLEVILIVFMLAAGTNFSLHYQLLRGNRSSIRRDPEWRFFMTTFIVATLVLTTVLWNAGGTIIASLRGVAFTVASIVTSTGFGTVNFDAWPEMTKMVILLLMFTGATAGSTGGGIKHVRVLLVMKLVMREMERARHPKAVVPVRLGRVVIQDRSLLAVVGFLFAFVVIWAFGTFVLMMGDSLFSNPADAASASVSALSNIGPGLGVVGPTHTYAALNPLSKITLAAEMWFGRLEIFTALVVFTPETWRH